MMPAPCIHPQQKKRENNNKKEKLDVFLRITVTEDARAMAIT